MQAMLGAALLAGSRDANQEVHDLANLYYRLLQQDVLTAERVVNSREKSPIYTFKETIAEEKMYDKVFTEFNTLSVLYGKSSDTFVDPEAASRRGRPIDDENEENEKEDQDMGGASLLEHADMIDFGEESASSRSGSAVDLLSMLEIDAPPAAPSSTAPAPFSLHPQPALDPATFQAKWTSASLVASDLRATLRSSSVTSTAEVTTYLSRLGVATMASGGPPDAMKFYFYAIDGANREIYLAEAMINARSREATFNLKCDGRGGNFAAFQHFFADSITSIT